MNVLLINPGYAETFWSMNRVLRMLGKKVLEPPLGLITVAAMLPVEWHQTLVELTARTVTEDEWRRADLVLVSGMAVQRAGMIEAIHDAKSRGKTVVVGGPLAFHVPEYFVDQGADIVVKGEGEGTVQILLEALSHKHSGTIIEEQGKTDMRTSPIPRFDLLDLDLYAGMDVQFSRGCPFKCEFCDVTLMYGRKVRTKLPGQMLAELDALYDQGWRRSVFFVDDNFIGNRAAARALLQELIPWMEKKGYPFDFVTQASVNLANDPEILDMMIKAGFVRVFLGIETQDVSSLKQAKKLQNAAVDLDEVCRRISRAGLQIIAGCIVGFDNEEPAADQRLLDFAFRNDIPEMFVTPLQAGPGTDLWLRLEKENRLLPLTFDDTISNQTGMVNFVPTRPLGEITREFVNLYQVLYEPGYYVDRVSRHFARMQKISLKKAFRVPYPGEIRAVVTTLFRQGVLYPSRRKFWRALLSCLLRFPGRFPQFMSACVMGEHYFDFRRTIAEKLHPGVEGTPQLSGTC